MAESGMRVGGVSCPGQGMGLRNPSVHPSRGAQDPFSVNFGRRSSVHTPAFWCGLVRWPPLLGPEPRL